MVIADLRSALGRRYPAGRTTKNVVGGNSSITATHFCMGHVTLDAHGGQVPWHDHAQEEVYFVLEGDGEICVGGERQTITGGQAVYIPPDTHHQLTNTGAQPLRMIYCYAPVGDVTHWRQELDGTLPVAGKDAPPLPPGARPQYAAR